jgi:hypothetical protein
MENPPNANVKTPGNIPQEAAEKMKREGWPSLEVQADYWKHKVTLEQRVEALETNTNKMADHILSIVGLLERTQNHIVNLIAAIQKAVDLSKKR